MRRRGISVGIAVVALCVALAVTFAAHDGRQDIDLRQWVGNDDAYLSH